MNKIPLAWLQLTREKVRLMVALAGIAFADILMFVQFGFRDALFDASVLFHNRLKGDIFLISPQSTCIIAMKYFSDRRLYQALAFKGVKSATPIYLGFAIWKNPANQNPRQLMVIGVNPLDKVLDLPNLDLVLDEIKKQDTIIFDQDSRPEFGPVAELFQSGEAVSTEVSNRRIRVGGLFKLGASFGADGNILTSDINFIRLFDQRKRGQIDIGALMVEEGVDVKLLVEEMRSKLPKDVLVLTKDELIAFEKNYWQTSTAIGFIFTLGAGMGFIVGIVIVYQILYTDVTDHLAEYATLKAMGYTDLYLLSVVFQEALILSIIGYLPGFLVSYFLYGLMQAATSLPIFMSVSNATTVLIMTVLMCVGSGAIAVRKLSAADPADIF